MPLTWGFNLEWQQEAIHQGRFNSDQQHGVLQLKTQFGYSLADQDRQHVCYAQLQPQVQAGKSLDDGWRIGLGPAMGCQNIWTDRFNSLVQLELPYWQDANQWNLRLNTGLNYAVDAQNSLRITWQYQQQNHVDWNKTSLGFVHYF